MALFNNNENRQKTPEVTPGDKRGMARHIFAVDSFAYGLSQQLGRYPARAAIESMQVPEQPWAAPVQEQARPVTPLADTNPTAGLDIEAIRRSVLETQSDV